MFRKLARQEFAGGDALRITGMSSGYPFSLGMPMDTRQQLFVAFPGIAKTQPGAQNAIPPLAAFRTGPVRTNQNDRRAIKMVPVGLKVDGKARKAKSAKQRPASPGIRGTSNIRLILDYS